jgi:hypothetical protein
MVRDWWMNPQRTDSPSSKSAGEWCDLKSALDAAFVVKSHELPLKTHQFKEHISLLFAAIEMPSAAWWLK